MEMTGNPLADWPRSVDTCKSMLYYERLRSCCTEWNLNLVTQKYIVNNVYRFKQYRCYVQERTSRKGKQGVAEKGRKKGEINE
jgi:hypothetical protein